MNLDLLSRAQGMSDSLAESPVLSAGGMTYLDYLIHRAVAGRRALLVYASVRADRRDSRLMRLLQLQKLHALAQALARHL